MSEEYPYVYRLSTLEKKVKALEEKQMQLRKKVSERLNILEENNEILESNSVNMANKIKVLGDWRYAHENWHLKLGKTIEALEEKVEKLIEFQADQEGSDNILINQKIEALESAQKWILEILCGDDYGSIIPQLKELRKQLEGKQ